MPGICITSTPKACGSDNHRSVSFTIDGQSFTFTGDELKSSPLTMPELRELVRLGARRLRASGITLANFLGRVTNGDEATNVKQYNFLAPGMAVTKTNIGTAYNNVLPGANGERVLVDCTGCVQFRVILTANLIGTGPFGARIVRDSDSTVFYENANIVQTGERELDTNWQTIPAWAVGLEILRLQAKSIVVADSPVFRRCVLLVR